MTYYRTPVLCGGWFRGAWALFIWRHMANSVSLVYVLYQQPRSISVLKTSHTGSICRYKCSEPARMFRLWDIWFRGVEVDRGLTVDLGSGVHHGSVHVMAWVASIGSSILVTAHITTYSLGAKYHRYLISKPLTRSSLKGEQSGAISCSLCLQQNLDVQMTFWQFRELEACWEYWRCTCI